MTLRELPHVVGSAKTGNIASTNALPSIAVSEEQRDPPPLIRYDSDSESSQPEGSTMVDERFLCEGYARSPCQIFLVNAPEHRGRSCFHGSEVRHFGPTFDAIGHRV